MWPHGLAVQRRSLLKATSLTLVGLSGCLDTVREHLPGNHLPSYVHTEFTVYQPGSAGYDQAPGVREPPRVEFEPQNDRVVVTGLFFVGSSSCNKAGLETISYDADSRRLDAEVRSTRQEDAGHACTGNESADAYRLVATFDEQFPERVDVTEGSDRDKQTTSARR
jgi:hypothetical protein